MALVIFFVKKINKSCSNYYTFYNSISFVLCSQESSIDLKSDLKIFSMQILRCNEHCRAAYYNFYAGKHKFQINKLILSLLEIFSIISNANIHNFSWQYKYGFRAAQTSSAACFKKSVMCKFCETIFVYFCIVQTFQFLLKCVIEQCVVLKI